MSWTRAVIFFFFFNDTATTEIYTLSLHDALPIRRCTGAATRSAEGGTPKTQGLHTGRPLARARRAGGCGGRTGGPAHAAHLQRGSEAADHRLGDGQALAHLGGRRDLPQHRPVPGGRFRPRWGGGFGPRRAPDRDRPPGELPGGHRPRGGPDPRPERVPRGAPGKL